MIKDTTVRRMLRFFYVETFFFYGAARYANPHPSSVALTLAVLSFHAVDEQFKIKTDASQPAISAWAR
jgi:hypothetical protein